MTIEAELPRLAGGSTRDHVLLANTALVDRVDLATPLSLSSQPATGLSALAPAQRAGAQRLRAWVNRVALTARRPLPVHPDEQTSSVSVGMSHGPKTDLPC